MQDMCENIIMIHAALILSCYEIVINLLYLPIYYFLVLRLTVLFLYLLDFIFRLLSSKMIFLVLYQYVTFPNIISELADGIQNQNLSKGRDKLMLLLLQFISGSIQKNPPQDFVEVKK